LTPRVFASVGHAARRTRRGTERRSGVHSRHVCPFTPNGKEDPAISGKGKALRRLSFLEFG